MVRKLILLLVSLLLNTTMVLGQLDRDEMQRARMEQNGVKICEQYTHKYVKGEPKAEGYLTTKTTFDRMGNPTLIINYRANGEESSRLYYSYDAQGRRVEYRKEEAWQDERTGKKSMRTFFRQHFTYDSRGNKKLESGFDGLSNYRVIYNYLPNGRLVDITKYNSDNSVAERWMYSYDGDTQFIHITPKSGEPYSVEKRFDKQGRLLMDKQIAQGAIEKRRLEFTYDGQGRVATESEYFGGQHRFTLRYVYNSKGQLVEIMQRKPNSGELQNNAYAYDREGNLIEERWMENDPKLISTKISEFDSGGDMVKMESYYAPYRYRVMYSYRYTKY